MTHDEAFNIAVGIRRSFKERAISNKDQMLILWAALGICIAEATEDQSVKQLFKGAHNA